MANGNNQQNNNQNRQQQSNQTAQSQQTLPQQPREEQIIASYTPTLKKENLKELLARLTVEVVTEKISAQQARQKMHDWYNSMSVSAQDEFKANRNSADETMNYFRGVLDTLAQELPYLFVR